MVTALTIYGADTAATTLTSAKIFFANTTGGSLNNHQTTIGTSTGYGEVSTSVKSTAWEALGAIGSAQGLGWLWDVTTLEGQQIIAGAWTPTLRFATSVGSIVADIYCRAWVYDSASNAVSPIGSPMVLANQTINTTNTNYTFAATTLPAQNFNLGQKAYCDVWLNIKTNSTGSTSATVRLFLSGNASLGNVQCQIVTPGYQAIPTGGASGQTVYFANQGSTTLTTANQLYITGGSPSTTNNTTQLGTATGYGEITSKGATSAWGANTHLPLTPTANGFLLEPSILNLAGATFNLSTWTATIRLQTTGTGAVSITAALHCRAFIRSSAGLYTQIAHMESGSVTITTTAANFTLTDTPSTTTTLTSGDALYLDIWANVTANTGASTQTISLRQLSTDTTGKTGSNQAQVVMPPYSGGSGGGGGGGGGGSTATGVSMVLTDAGANLIRDGLSGSSKTLISYFAVGSSNTQPDTSDVDLGQEVFRKKVRGYTNGSHIGELLVDCYLAPTEAAGADIEEIGVFGGNATSAANSGTLIAHGLYAHNPKGNTESIQITIDIQL